jgi:formamidopyrimidine-DNA glycosylase
MHLSNNYQPHERSSPVPELPEVQTVVNNLKALDMIAGVITRARVYWPKTVSGMSPQNFRRQIKNLTVCAITRRGKYIVIHLSQGWALLIHLRMTGRLNWVKAGTRRDKHEHVVLQLGSGNELRFHDTRKFGRFTLTRTPGRILDKIGIEPLDKAFTRQHFIKMLQSKKRLIKPLLLDQRFIAGLGNIYVDEALWKARIHPLRVSHTLSKNEMAALHQAIPHVLKKGLRNMGTTLGAGEGNFYSVGSRRGRNADELNVFRRTGEACPNCNTAIERIIVGQRSSHICPECQILPL